MKWISAGLIVYTLHPTARLIKPMFSGASWCGHVMGRHFVDLVLTWKEYFGQKYARIYR